MSLSDRCEELERELAETRAIIDKEAQDYAQTYLDNQALAAQAVQMREALEMISNTTDETGVCGNGYSASYVAEQAISIDTKPAEQIVNQVKAQALREAADVCERQAGEYGEPGWIQAAINCATELRSMANELDPRCRKCGGNMIQGKAIQQTLTGTPDFPGDDHAVTLSPGGSGKLIDCMKCEKCGWSVTG